MRIEGYSRTAGVGARAGVGRSGSAGAVFQPDMGEMPRVANARATSPTAGIDALLALQAIEDPVLKRRKTVRRGRPASPSPKRHINIRLSARVVEHFKATGPGWQGRIDAALLEWIERHGR